MITREQIEQSLARLMPEASPPPSGWLRREELQDLMGLKSTQTKARLNQWVADGKIPPPRIFRVIDGGQPRHVPHYFLGGK